VRLLYVSGTYMPAAGGAEISSFSLLRALSRLGLAVTVFTSSQVAADPRYGELAGIEVVHTTRSHLVRHLAEHIRRQPGEVLLTQNLWADTALSFAKAAGIPSVYYARTAFGELDLKSQFLAPHTIVANSEAVREYIKAKWDREAYVVRSIVDLDAYRVDQNTREFITIVNPIELKGGKIFRAIARRSPERSFMAVEGWGHLRAADGWNLELLRDLSAGFGSGKLWIPQEVDLSDLKNVTLTRGVEDMKQIYSKTRILLVPSITAESAPRVAVEAMSNGIPVIGSRIGGIPESLGNCGKLVDPYGSVDEWLTALKVFDDPEDYELASERSRLHVSCLDFEGEVRKFKRLIEKIVSSPWETEN
jgi:glycosyltransferase involved in cell wall biosynthesis